MKDFDDAFKKIRTSWPAEDGRGEVDFQDGKGKWIFVQQAEKRFGFSRPAMKAWCEGDKSKWHPAMEGRRLALRSVKCWPTDGGYAERDYVSVEDCEAISLVRKNGLVPEVPGYRRYDRTIGGSELRSHQQHSDSRHYRRRRKGVRDPLIGRRHPTKVVRGVTNGITYHMLMVPDENSKEAKSIEKKIAKVQADRSGVTLWTDITRDTTAGRIPHATLSTAVERATKRDRDPVRLLPKLPGQRGPKELKYVVNTFVEELRRERGEKPASDKGEETRELLQNIQKTGRETLAAVKALRGAVQDSKEDAPKKGKPRGRRPLSSTDRRARIDLLADWDRASGAGIDRATFCEGKGITVLQLERVQQWNANRQSRTFTE